MLHLTRHQAFPDPFDTFMIIDGDAVGPEGLSGKMVVQGVLAP